jgi:transcriptional regulator with AAA-type ATPase domain
VPFREVSRRLSEKSRNYFFYEYEYLYFELAAEPGFRDDQEQDRFLAMYDFFTMNKRTLSEKLKHLRSQLQEREDRGHLFADARLVENFRQWRLPEDFFNSFRHALNQNLRVDWLSLYVFRDGRPLFRFCSSNLFRELAEEMMHDLLRQPESRNWDLAEVQARFSSQERLFFPFACTKMTCWPITDDLRAGLIAAFRDRESYFRDFFARNKAIIDKFSLLFQNFFENEYNIREKLDFIIGNSEKVKEMKREIAQVSKVDFSLLITGESGSGKELVAQAVHRLSPRANQPFISVNAAALPETLLEAELFGFKKGAFSGALENRIGLLEAADRGTFFLDEVADLPLNLQAKMLRVLQEKEIRRLGENRTVPIDIRLISASNRNLEEMIANGRFREDLYYRLQDLTIQIPPLRERREDIPLLTAHFLKKFGKQPPAAQNARRIAALFQYESFPGNVRELESKIKKLITFDPGLEVPPPPEAEAFSLKNARDRFDRSLLISTLEESRWNRNQAAEKLGISRMALFNLLKKHRIRQ